MRNFTIVLADGTVRTARTWAVTLRGVLVMLDVRTTPSMYLNDKWEVWDAATGELVGLLSEN